MEEKIKRAIRIGKQISEQLEAPGQKEPREIEVWKNESGEHQNLYNEVTSNKSLKEQHQF